MKMLLLTQDLMIGSRMEGVARQHGLKLLTLGSQAEVIEVASETESQILIVDLQVCDLDIGTFVKSVRSSRGSGERPLPIVAFGPHVQEANLAAAQKAKCDAVLTRGQLDREAGNLVGTLIRDIH